MQQEQGGEHIDVVLVLPPEMDGESDASRYDFARDCFKKVSRQGGNPDIEIIFGSLPKPMSPIVEGASFVAFPYAADKESETHFHATVFFPTIGKFNIYVYKNRKPFLERAWFFLYTHPFFGEGVFLC